MFRTWGPATVLLLTLAIIVVAVGGVVVIVQPDTLSFAQYLDDLKTFGLALAGLAVGRGIHLGLQGGDPAPTVGRPELDDTTTVAAANDHSQLNG